MARIVAFEPQPKWGSIIAAVSIAFICLATLTPGAPQPPPGAVRNCEPWCDDPLLADFLRNIILFAPMGFGLRLAGVRARWAILAGTLLSATVELLQLRVIVGRDASVLDWISNTLGTMAGVGIADQLRAILLPLPRMALRLTIGALVGWIIILVLGAWGIQPAPTEFPYWGQRTPRLRQYPPFRGQLLSGRVNGTELPSARLSNDENIRGPLRAGRSQVDAVVQPGLPSPPAEIAPILRVADGTLREILLLGRSDKELVFRYRLGATRLRLETPAFALARAFPPTRDMDGHEPESPESLLVVLDRGRLTLTARNQAGTDYQVFELTAASAWSFFLPWDYWYGPNAALLSLFWLGTLLLPAGYWGARTGARRTRWTALAVAIMIVPATLVLLPRAFPLAPPKVSQFIAAIGGFAFGWILATLVERRQQRRVLTPRGVAIPND